MEFSWTIFVLVFTANLAWIGIMYLAQEFDDKMPPRRMYIPHTNQRFLHMEDFWTMTWGDIIGVGLTNTAFAHLAVNGCFRWQDWCIFVILFVVTISIFLHICLSKNHKPDMGYPAIGKISWNGILHLPYFGFGVVAGIFSVWSIFTGDLCGSVLYIGLCGGIFYAFCLLLEIRSGNFDAIKKV